MSKNGKNGKGVLADPTRLQPLDPDEKELITVVVETPKGIVISTLSIPSKGSSG